MVGTKCKVNFGQAVSNDPSVPGLRLGGHRRFDGIGRLRHRCRTRVQDPGIRPDRRGVDDRSRVSAGRERKVVGG